MSLKEERRGRWLRLMEEHSRSGLSVAAWCRTRGLHPSSFFEWRRRLGWQAGASVPGPGWLQVACVETPQSTGPAERVDGNAGFRACLTLRIGSVSIELGSGFDRDLLGDVLDILEARAC